MMASVTNPLEDLDKNLLVSLQSDAAMAASEKQKREQMQKAAVQLQKMVWEQRRRHAENEIVTIPVSQVEGSLQQEVDAIACARAKELEIQKRKTQVQGKVRAHLSRLESQGRRLEELTRELDSLEDPTRKEVAEIRRKIELVDRDLKPIKQLCDKKEKELKEAMKLFSEKNKLKNDLVSKLMEIVTSSEQQRLEKLDELNKQLESMEISKQSV